MTSVELRNEQRLTGQLNLQQLQSITVLQLSAAELDTYLYELSLENPMIELNGKPQEARAVSVDELLWADGSARRTAGYRDDEGPAFSVEMVGTDGGLRETLLRTLIRQIERLPADPNAKSAARYLAACLEDDGYLRTPLDELARDAGLPSALMEEGFRLLRSLEPAGVGAQNLSDCLVLQLERIGADPIAIRIASQLLDALSKNRIRQIAEELGVSEREAAEACRLIRTLDPKPGARFAAWEQTVYVRPDLVIERRGDGFAARLTRESDEPPFSVSAHYARMLSETDDPAVRDYLTEKLRQAKMLLYGIRQRDSSLLRCGNAIANAQAAFFASGPGHLRPYRMTDAARELKLHVSTVSRIVREKYVRCSFGVFPMRRFFAGQAASDGTGGVSAEKIRQQLRRLLEEETEPLSDRQLCEALRQQGVAISRRAVAKYRGQLGFSNSYGRRIL